MPAIHQLVAGFSHGDAISNEALAMRAIFRGWGFASNIYSENRRILPELRTEALDLPAHRADFGPGDIALLHLSIGSMVNELFAELPCRKAILYHNITPPEYFRGLQEQIAHNLAQGREQARALAGAAQVAMADSAYNAHELQSFGHGEVGVLPLILDLNKLRAPPNRSVIKQFDDGIRNILFVGRCVPNKRIEELLATMHYLQRYIEPASRLIHVGSYAGTEQYHALLLALIRDLHLERVEMPGSVPQDQLNAYYESADVFLCLSDHEGFCIPLLEAMVHDVPVIAAAEGAVPETLDGAGVLLHEKRYDLIAETIGRVLRDEPLRRAILEGQRERLRRFEARNPDAELRALLAPLLAG